MPSDAHEDSVDRERAIAADDSAVRRIKAECSGSNALQTSASASRELPFVQPPPYLLSRVFFRHVPLVVDTYQYSQILVSTTKRRFTKRKSKSHLTKSRNQLTPACASSSMPLGCFLLRREIHASASDHKARLSRKRLFPAHERAVNFRKFLKLVSF